MRFVLHVEDSDDGSVYLLLPLRGGLALAILTLRDLIESPSMRRARLIAVLVVVAAIATAYAMTRIGDLPEQVIAPQGVVMHRPPEATLEVTCIANEGVLIAAGGTQVLIDGLHRPYRSSYPVLPEPYREQIETAQAPFHESDLFLVSHMHLDHFHPESVARHLRHNAGARFVSSKQVVGEIEALVKALQSRRAEAETPVLEPGPVGQGTGRREPRRRTARSFASTLREYFRAAAETLDSFFWSGPALARAAHENTFAADCAGCRAANGSSYGREGFPREIANRRAS